jgi:chemotaxis protein CheD
MSSTISAAATCHLVGMGQIAVFTAPETARAVLGSCIGVAIFDDSFKFAAFAHVVLPSSEGRSVTSAGKYADTAIDAMRDSLLKRGANPKRLVAKIAGGAQMFVGKGPFQIGVQNIDAVRSLLNANFIRIAGEHLGGAQGRRVTFEPKSFTLAVEIAGQPTLQL